MIAAANLERRVFILKIEENCLVSVLNTSSVFKILSLRAYTLTKQNKYIKYLNNIKLLNYLNNILPRNSTAPSLSLKFTLSIYQQTYHNINP